MLYDGFALGFVGKSDPMQIAGRAEKIFVIVGGGNARQATASGSELQLMIETKK